MARSFGVVKTSVWEPRSEFRTLSLPAQWVYMMLLSQPQITNLGILAYSPGKWARLAAGLALDDLEQAINELAAAYYVLVDRDADELLVRTFVKHDKVWSQPKLVKNARRLIHEVESDEIRDYLAARHPWLLDESGKAEIEAYELDPERTTETTSGTSFSQTATPLSPPHARAGAGPGAGAGSSSKGKEENQEPKPQEPAAAELDAPRTARIKAVANRWGADLQVLEREALVINSILFEDVVDRHTARCDTGKITNPAGLLVDLLKRARREAAKREIQETEPRSLMQIACDDAKSYARGDHPWEVANELLTRKLTRLGAENGTSEALLAAARAAYRTECARSETP